MTEKFKQIIAKYGVIQELQLEVGITQNTYAQHQQMQKQAWIDSATQRLMQTPLLQALVKEFDARIIPGSVKPFGKKEGLSV